MKGDPQKHREWQERSRKRQLQKRAQRAKAGRPTQPSSPDKSRGYYGKLRSNKRRKSDAPWRMACIERYGSWCRVCGNSMVQMDHIMPRGQGGPSVVENGLPLCAVHHEQKTHATLKIRPEWLDDQQIAWLAEVGWVEWDDEGKPHGHGWKHFHDMRHPSRKGREDDDNG